MLIQLNFIQEKKLTIKIQNNVGDHVRISKNKSIFGKGHMPNWSEEVFVIKKVKSAVPWTYVINDLFMKKNCRRLIKKNSE